MGNTIIPADVGFSVADGEKVKALFNGKELKISFTNWMDKEVSFVCLDTLAFRWQLAEYYFEKQERPDSIYEILESDWLRMHEEQGMNWNGVTFRHFKMNFNASGILEVLCSRIQLT